METIEKATYRIPSANMELLTYKLGQLNKKAKKLGSQPVELVILEKQEYENWYEQSQLDPNGGKVKRPFPVIEIYYLVEVSGEAPKYSGWTFVGTLQYTENGNILRAVPGEIFPEEYRTVKATCDHCKSSRYRKDTFVVRNENGQHLQVGRSCIKDFLGHKSPEQIANTATWLADINDLLGEGEEEYGSCYGGRQATRYPLLYWLGWVAESIIRNGWVSRRVAREYDKESTSSDAYDNMEERPVRTSRGLESSRKYEPSEEALATAQAAYDWARNLIGQEGLNDFLYNVSVVTAADEVTYKELGIAAAIVSSYQRSLVTEAERKAKAKTEAASQYVGTVGKRQEFEVTVAGVHFWNTDFYGTMYLYRFLDAEGNILVWKTNGPKGMEEGGQYTIKATVKDHSEYKDVKQTVLTRCAIQ
jgi:hypothetical protein